MANVLSGVALICGPSSEPTLRADNTVIDTGHPQVVDLDDHRRPENDRCRPARCRFCFSAAATAAPDPRAALDALGVAYVVFACDEPSLFKLMFGPAIEQKPAHPGLNEAGCTCFDALRQAVKAARFFDGDRQLRDVSLACWSLVHGLASLIVDGRLAEENVGTPEAMATRLTQLLSDSLAALGKTPTAGTLALTNGRPR